MILFASSLLVASSTDGRMIGKVSIEECQSVADWLQYSFFNNQNDFGYCTIHHAGKSVELDGQNCEEALPSVECFTSKKIK